MRVFWLRWFPGNLANPLNRINPNTRFNPINARDPNNPLNLINHYNPDTPFHTRGEAIAGCNGLALTSPQGMA